MRDKRSKSYENLNIITSPGQKPRPPHQESGLRHVRSEPHILRHEVESLLSGLEDNTVIVLPRTCCEAAGLAPNINDKQQPKHLWIGRLKHLNRLLSAQWLQQAVQPQEVRRSFLQAALDEVESRQTASAEIPMQLAQLPGWKLQQMAHAAIVIQKMWRGRRARKANSLSVLNAFAGCITKGTVVFLCGSTGIAGDSLRYVRMLAGMGYLVIAPDDLAGTSHLRRRQPRLMLRPEQATDYWERNLLYEDAGAEGELVYSSTSEGVLASPEHFDQIYNNIITVRQAEAAFTIRRLPAFIKRQGIFLFGMSEGAVTLSTFHDEHFASMIRGRVLASYSCEMNYWNYNRPEDVGIAGSPDVPTLNLMGFEDEYFGVNNSVAATVAAYGDYPPIAGHAFQPMVERGLEWGLVCHFEGGRHALLLSHDDVIREVLSDFLVRPLTTCRSLGVLWGNLPELQDEITRVRRSNDERVLYVRIRPPPALPTSQQPNERREALLDALSAKLYEVEHRSESLAALSWSDLQLARAHSPPGSAAPGGSLSPAGASPRGSSPGSSLAAGASSVEGGATPTAAGVDKLRAKAASARLLAHFSFKAFQASQGQQQQGNSPEGDAHQSNPNPGAVGTTLAEQGSPTGRTVVGSQERRVVGFASSDGAQQPEGATGNPSLAAMPTIAAVDAASAEKAAAAARGNREGAGSVAAAGGAGAGSVQPGTEGSQYSTAAGGRAWSWQQATSASQQGGRGAALSTLSAALRGSSGSLSAQASPPGAALARTAPHATLARVNRNSPRAAESLRDADAAGTDGCSGSSGSGRSSPSDAQPEGSPLGANGALAAAAIHFSPVQRLLASSLASERSSPFNSPTNRGSGRHYKSPRSGKGMGQRRAYHSRSLSAAAIGAASPHPTPEEFEAGLETLQGWMSSQGRGSPGPPTFPACYSPQRVARPHSAQSTDESQQRRLRSVHFSQPPALPDRSASSEGTEGSTSGLESSGELLREVAAAEQHKHVQRGSRMGLTSRELQQLLQATAAQAQASTMASQAAAASARAASLAAACSFIAVAALAFILAGCKR